MKKEIILFSLLCFFLMGTNAQNMEKFNKLYTVIPGVYCYSDRIYICSGGYMIYGGTRDSNGLYKVVMLKIDTLGNLLWKKSYGKNGYNYYEESIIPGGGGVSVPWGGYIEPGSISRLNTEQLNLVLYRFDTKGDTVWTRIYNDSANEAGITVKITREKQYIIGAEWANFKGSGFYTTTLKKTDTLGNTIWQKTYHGLPSHYRESLSLDTCKDEGYIICAFDGDTNNDEYGCGNRIFIMKTDSAGTPQWTKYINDPVCFNFDSYVLSLRDGSYIVCGWYVDSVQFSGARQFDKLYLAKISPSGSIKWVNQYGFGSWIASGLYSMKELPNGDIITSGEDSISALGCILKLDSNGNQKWLRYYSKQSPAEQDYLQDIQLTSDGGYVAAGATYGATQNIWVVKVDSLGCDTVGCDFTGITELKEENKQFNLYPNPANSHLTIAYQLVPGSTDATLILYDVLGNKVVNYTLPAMQNVITENITNLAPGFYLYSVSNANNIVQRGKIVITR